MSYSDLERRMAEVERRLNNIIIRSSAIKTESGQASIRVADGSGFESGSVEYFQGRAGKNATWSPIDEGEQGLLFCPSGDPAQAVFLGGLPSKASPAISGNQNEQRTNFGDGSFMSYDRSSNSAILNLGQNANITIIKTDWAGDVNITGNVKIDGLLTVTKNTNIQQNLTVGGGITFGGGAARSSAVLRGTGNIDLKGSITSTGDQKAGGISQINHTHTGDNGGNTSQPK